jgi:hypothetical protein
MSTQVDGFDQLPNFLTVDDLVEALQLPSKSTVYTWNRMGKGPSYYRVGKDIRYRKSEVLRSLQEHNRAGELGITPLDEDQQP